MISHALLDVDDVEAFVAAMIVRSRVRMSPDEHDEMLAEGICLLYELARKYEPHREGYQQAGSFAGYAAALLPKRMKDAWHRLHPEHVETRRPDGKREYEWAPPALSLHAEDAPQLAGTVMLGPLPDDNAPPGYTPPPTVASALSLMDVHHQVLARPMVRLIEDGYSTDQIARSMRVGRRLVSNTWAAIGSAVYQALQEAA